MPSARCPPQTPSVRQRASPRDRSRPESVVSSFVGAARAANARARALALNHVTDLFLRCPEIVLSHHCKVFRPAQFAVMVFVCRLELPAEVGISLRLDLGKITVVILVQRVEAWIIVFRFVAGAVRRA